MEYFQYFSRNFFMGNLRKLHCNVRWCSINVLSLLRYAKEREIRRFRLKSMSFSIWPDKLMFTQCWSKLRAGFWNRFIECRNNIMCMSNQLSTEQQKRICSRSTSFVWFLIALIIHEMSSGRFITCDDFHILIICILFIPLHRVENMREIEFYLLVPPWSSSDFFMLI